MPAHPSMLKNEIIDAPLTQEHPINQSKKGLTALAMLVAMGFAVSYVLFPVKANPPLNAASSQSGSANQKNDNQVSTSSHSPRQQ
jgi:hypothetical protein